MIGRGEAAEQKRRPPWSADDQKLKKKNLLKCPKAVQKKLGPKYKLFKVSYLDGALFQKISFRAYNFIKKVLPKAQSFLRSQDR